MNLIYETDRLHLRVLHENDANKVLSFYIDNESFFNQYEPAKLPNFYTLAFQKKVLHYEYQQMQQLKSLRYYVFDKKDTHTILGCINFSNIIRGPFLSCQVGYKFDWNQQKKGYATESLLKGVEIIFNEYTLHRIEAMIMPSNTKSIHLVKKIGFQYEGLSPSYAMINGVWQDHGRFSLINPDI